ncbi:MAG: VWA domain-containing protein [Pseudomonadota bacterium]
MTKNKNVTSSSSPADAGAEFLGKARALSAIAPASGPAQARLIFAMDATASRQPSWDRAADIQAGMFDAVARLGTLDIQLVYFRGFDECKASNWCRDAVMLRDRMTAVDCRAGHTQLGRVLEHVIRQHQKKPVNALIYVGDCLEEEADHLGNQAGQLGLTGVRAFMFHEGSDLKAAQVFRNIARVTGGAFARFDSSAPDRLKELLGAIAAFAMGGFDELTRYEAHQGSPELRLLTDQLRRDR